MKFIAGYDPANMEYYFPVLGERIGEPSSIEERLEDLKWRLHKKIDENCKFHSEVLDTVQYFRDVQLIEKDSRKKWNGKWYAADERWADSIIETINQILNPNYGKESGNDF